MNSSYAMKMKISIFLIVCALYTSSVSGKIYLTRKMNIKIVNGLPNNDDPLEVRCQDGNTDKGLQTLLVGEDLDWSFHNNFDGRTLWWCHFYWADKSRPMMVYDDHGKYPLCLEHKSLKGKTCYWLVREDGFYSSTHEQDPSDKKHAGIRLAGWDENDGPWYDNPPPAPTDN